MAEALPSPRDRNGKSKEFVMAKKVQTVNKYIAKHRKDDIYAIEPDSTWEEPYEFSPIVVKGKFIYFQWAEPYKKGKKQKERYNINDEMHEDDIKYMFNWVIKAIKKGYREEGQTPPKF